MLDQMGERYGLLPSQVLAQSDSLDIKIWATVNEWQRKQHQNQSGKPASQVLSTAEMSKMVEAAKHLRRSKRESNKSN